MKFFHVLPVGGLCNRLRVIKSTRQLSRDYNRPATIWWAVNRQMNTRFTDLFEYDRSMGFLLREGRLSSLFSRFLFSKYNTRWCDWQEVNKFLSNFSNGKFNYLSTFTDFYKVNGGYDFLMPKAHIAMKVAEWRSKLGDQSFGFHIRRTDNVKSIKFSPDDLFINKAKVLIENDNRVKFFLATDDSEVRTKFRRLFGGHCVTRDVAARHSINGVEDAVVDMLLLSSCKRGVYGSYWSSFSEVAAEVGRCPFEQLMVKDEVNHEQRI